MEAHTDHETKALKGAGTGAAIGGTAGAVLAAITAVGTSLVIPGLGLVIAGPLVAAFAGAGAGGTAGGLIGALVGHGIPEDRAKKYQSRLDVQGAGSSWASHPNRPRTRHSSSANGRTIEPRPSIDRSDNVG